MSHISRNKAIGGNLILTGTNIAVNQIKALHRAGESVEAINKRFDVLSPPQIAAAINYGKRQDKLRLVILPGAAQRFLIQ